MVLAGEDFVADRDDQPVSLVASRAAVVIGIGRGLLQDRIGRDHLARHQVLADAEMLERALRLRAPELVGGHIDLAEAVGFLANGDHVEPP